MFSEVSFDITQRSLNESPTEIITSEEDYNPEVSLKKTPSKDWELDVRPMISTKKWLLNYGLKKNKLSLFHLLPAIGFKLSDGRIFRIIAFYLVSTVHCLSEGKLSYIHVVVVCHQLAYCV